MDKKPTLLVCQTCGLEPKLTKDNDQRGPWAWCSFCNTDHGETGPSESWHWQEWNARQFEARHDAIDRLVLAMAANPRAASYTAGAGGINAWAKIQYEDNLARRRAEAEALMRGE